jgi:hypothetical protein
MTATDVEAPAASPARSARGKAPHAMLVLGTLLVGLGLTVTRAVAPLVAALFEQRDDGYLTSPAERYQVPTYAITWPPLDVAPDGGPATQGRKGAVPTVMLSAQSATPGQDVFVGIGPRDAVTRYLADVDHSELTQLRLNPFRASYQDHAGSTEPGLPSVQDFWDVSAQGPGTQQIESDLPSGNWAAVIMNADGSRPVAVDLQAGIRTPLLAPTTWGTLFVGLALLALGIPVVLAGAARLGRSLGHAPGSAQSAGLRPWPRSLAMRTTSSRCSWASRS